MMKTYYDSRAKRHEDDTKRKATDSCKVQRKRARYNDNVICV